MVSLKTVTLGFLPLTDCMLPVVAKEKGFAQHHGIDLVLSKEQSWASIRDHMTVGHYDVAHMLAPMPIAFNLGLVPFSVPVIAPISLGLGGNAVTVSNVLWDALLQVGASPSGAPSRNGAALKTIVEERMSSNREKIRFGVVHPFSGHNLELRYWFAACGIKPDLEVEIIIVPPPLMPDALAAGKIDGFCVGEPWNSVAVDEGVGKIVTTKSAIWKSSPEKVLGVQAGFAENEPNTLAYLLRSLHEAALWCGEERNRKELSEILAKPEYVAASSQTILRALTGAMKFSIGNVTEIDDFLISYQRAATFPWQSHALWFYSQMVRWGQVEHSPSNANIARNSYRPDLYRAALAKTNAAIPTANMKVEGALEVPTAVGSSERLILGPDGFFDGRIFDPDQLEDYLKQFT